MGTQTSGPDIQLLENSSLVKTRLQKFVPMAADPCAQIKGCRPNVLMVPNQTAKEDVVTTLELLVLTVKGPPLALMAPLLPDLPNPALLVTLPVLMVPKPSVP